MSGFEVVNVGDLPNDGNGDPIRLAFEKINNNFANLFGNANTEGIILTEESTSNIANIEVIEDAIIVDPPVMTFAPSSVSLFSTPPPPPPPPPTLTSNPNFEIVNVGALPNDGTGDPLRVAFTKINNNFSDLFLTSTNVSNTYTVGNTPGQVIWETPITQFSQGTFQVRSGDPETPNSQDITITAHIINNLTNVKWNGFGTTFNGSPVTTYDMDVLGGNVRLLVNPLVNEVLQHLISSSVTYIDVSDDALAIQLDGYVDSEMATENDLIITTE